VTGRTPSIWQALAAFLALPTVVGFVVPWLLRPPGARVSAAGAVFLAIGVVLLVWCVRDFYVTGKGTLAPWAPPQRLVTTGLYRISRNPMYLAVITVLCGWAIGARSPALWVYLACVALAFQLRVVFGEEPWLARTHGAAWAAYRARVRRWL
jgi:protein-S-isoprenylcysteine O-methyltransferase Ste14